MTQYKLTYFDITGFAEPIRFLFAYGSIKYEDNRLPLEQFLAIKSSITPPYSQVPIIEFDGQMISQNVAVCRYLARKIGLYGKNVLDDLLVDEAIDLINDVRAKMSVLRYEKDETIKAKKLADLKTETIPY